MAKLSITRRLIVSVLLTQLVLTIAVVSLATYLTRRQLGRSFDAALHGRAMSIAALVRYSEDAKPDLEFDASLVPLPLQREHQDFYLIVAEDGRVIAHSPNWFPEFPTAPKRQRTYWTVNVRGDQYRIVRLKDIPVLDREGPETITSATITVLYAASTDEMRRRAWMLAILTGVGSLVLLSISTGVTVWAVRRGLSPLADLVSSASRVTADNWKLDAPEEARQTRELTPLTDAMDSMLASLQQAFTTQREFIANAAHELKTPISVLKSTVQSLLQKPRTAEEYRAQLEGALEDIARLEKLTHSMLRLARAEQTNSGPSRLHMPLVDLASNCEQSAEHLRRVAESKSVEIRVQSQGTPSIHAEPEDLELIWTNLLENAIRYSPHNSAIVLAVSMEDDNACVSVRDNGPGIAKDDLQNIFNRFHRIDASRARESGGYGLGLAIVQAMVHAYGGTIVAESQLGIGTTMSVRFPVQA